MSVRRQSRVSSHASLPEQHKSDAASSERSTRSRTSSEDLVVLELPKIVRTKRSSHQKSGVEGHDPIKNGKGNSMALSSEEELTKRDLHSTVSNNKDASVSIGLQGSGDARILGRTRRKSGRLSGTNEEPEKAPSLQQDTPKEGRSLRSRTRSGTASDHVGNGPAERPKDSELETSQPDAQDTHGTHTTSSNKARTEDSSTADARCIAEASSSNELHHEQKESPESTSVHLEPNPFLSVQTGDTDLQTETVVTNQQTVTADASGTASCDVECPSEQPQKVKEKTTRLDPTPGSSSGLYSRTSPRRARQAHTQPAENTDNLPNDKELSDPVSKESHTLVSNGVRGGKTTPRKRTRSSSTSISPRKPSENQDADSVVPSSPKRRKAGSVCRDLSQDFNTAKPLTADTALSPDPQAQCNNEIMADPQDSSLNMNRIPVPVLSDGVEEETLKSGPSTHGDLSGSTVETLIPEAVTPKRSRRTSGTSPRGTPQKQAQLDLTKSPTRRGLRSGGAVPETPPEVGQSSGVTADGNNTDKITVTPSTSPVDSSRKSSSKKKGSGKKEVVSARGDAKEFGDGKEELGEGSQDIRLSREDVDYQAEEWYEDVDESEPFYFESDHMAIKGNKDYRMLLRTLTTLEAQRKQAVQDLDRLLECRDKALKNPIKFVHKLQHKDSLNLPHSQRVVMCPDIDWGRYIGPPETNELLGLVSQPRSMRPSKSSSVAAQAQAGCGSCSTGQAKPVPMAPPAVPTVPSAVGAPAGLDQDTPSTSSTPDPGQSGDAAEIKPDVKVDVVRGRLAEGNKPPTFNQLWTRDEQRRLEELLVKFPMEEVEARRWEKIAKALGNRTAQQVASRVQKYFIKLMKAGLPVPGRLPNLATYQNNKRTGKKMHPFTKPLFQPSTFLQSIQPPVYMADDDPYGYAKDNLDDDDDDDELVSDDESIPTDVRDTAEYQELIRLKFLKKQKFRRQGHAGFRCDGCDMEPIVGVRWHCVECPDPVSTDLCQSCVNCNYSSKHHSSSHRMEPVHTSYSQSFVDGDYTSFEPSSGDYNYLDPNYNPMQTT